MSTVDPRTTAQFWDAIANATTADLDATYQAAIAGHASGWFDTTSRLLAAVHPDLSFVIEVGPSSPQLRTAMANGLRPTIEITGDGLHHAVPAVLAVVDAAPTPVTNRFDVRAFRARSTDPVGPEIRVGSTVLSAETVSWTASPTPGRPDSCNLTVFVPGWIEALGENSPYNEARLQAVFLLLDHQVGEYAVMTQLGGLRLHAATSTPADAQPLHTLGDHLDRIAAA